MKLPAICILSQVLLKYEQTLAAIDEARFKRTNIQMQYAMMAQAQQEIENDETDVNTEPVASEQSKRKLRKG